MWQSPVKKRGDYLAEFVLSKAEGLAMTYYWIDFKYERANT